MESKKSAAEMYDLPNVVKMRKLFRRLFIRVIEGAKKCLIWSKTCS